MYNFFPRSKFWLEITVFGTTLLFYSATSSRGTIKINPTSTFPFFFFLFFFSFSILRTRYSRYQVSAEYKMEAQAALCVDHVWTNYRNLQRSRRSSRFFPFLNFRKNYSKPYCSSLLHETNPPHYRLTTYKLSNRIFEFSCEKYLTRSTHNRKMETRVLIDDLESSKKSKSNLILRNLRDKDLVSDHR